MRRGLFAFGQLFGDDVQNFLTLVETAELADLMAGNRLAAMTALGQRVGLQSQMAPPAELLAFGHMMTWNRQFCARVITIAYKIVRPAPILPLNPYDSLLNLQLRKHLRSACPE